MNDKSVLSLVVSLCLVLSAAPRATAQQTAAPDANISPDEFVYENYLAVMDETSALMRDVRAHLDRSAFDVGALVTSLNFDADEIIEFSKRSLAYEQYPGVLRGPLGTLFSRAGNSIDQSLLLAALLRDAGYEARIAGAELGSEASRAVLEAMKRPMPPAPPFGDANGILNVLARNQDINAAQREAYADYVRAAPAVESTDVFPKVSSTAGFIKEQLSSAGVELNDSGAADGLIDEARQYYWVQYRDRAAGPWTDVHPVFIDEAPFATPTPSTYISESVPESLQHRFRFQVFIERKVGNRLESLPVMNAWEAPVANLIGVPLSFSNVGNVTLTPESLRNLEDTLSSSRTFLPMFAGSLAAGGQAFDMRGNLLDPMAAMSSAAGIFATVDSAFSSAIGAIGDASAVPTLTAQWLEFTLISPGGEELVFRRTTFDRIGTAARRDNRVPAELAPTAADDARTLLQRHTFMLAGGVFPRGYVLDAAFDHFEYVRPGIDALVDMRYERPPRQRSLSADQAGWGGHVALASIFDMVNTIEPSHRSYRSGPALVVHSIGLGSSDGTIESVDIVSNPRRAIDIRGETPALDPEHALQAGVWETAVEGVLLSGRGQASDTWRAFDAAENAGIAPVVLVPGQPRPNLSLSADTYAAIDRDLSNGYAVIVPGAESATETIGWWRVNLETGETLGQLGDGRGQSAEQVIQMSISITSFAISASGCSALDGLPYVCCISANTALFMAGLAVSLPLALSAVIDIGGAAFPFDKVCSKQD